MASPFPRSIPTPSAPVTARRSTQASRAAIRRDHLGQFSGRLAVRTLHLVSTEISFVKLADARTLADDLWEGAIAPHTHASVRQGYIARLHTLAYQLLAEIAGRNMTTVAIETGGARLNATTKKSPVKNALSSDGRLLVRCGHIWSPVTRTWVLRRRTWVLRYGPGRGARMNTKDPVELIDAINLETTKTIALLNMLHVFCNLEQRDITRGCVDGTLSDAATGLAVLMDDLADRVESIKNNANELFELAGGVR